MVNIALLPVRSLQCKTGAGEDQEGSVYSFSLLGKCNERGIWTDYEQACNHAFMAVFCGLVWMDASELAGEGDGGEAG